MVAEPGLRGPATRHRLARGNGPGGHGGVVRPRPDRGHARRRVGRLAGPGLSPGGQHPPAEPLHRAEPRGACHHGRHDRTVHGMGADLRRHERIRLAAVPRGQPALDPRPGLGGAHPGGRGLGHRHDVHDRAWAHQHRPRPLLGPGRHPGAPARGVHDLRLGRDRGRHGALHGAVGHREPPLPDQPRRAPGRPGPRGRRVLADRRPPAAVPAEHVQPTGRGHVPDTLAHSACRGEGGAVLRVPGGVGDREP
ncbi:hypothetical protein ACFFX0_22310 [Citricoccus parietis]|uniref:Uncharacterized protein n=1 Tax=Citricoccus parietis TaxID=592307 RepID=A0ABV5G4D0_9MICC